MAHRSPSRGSLPGDATPRAAYFSKQQTDLRSNRPSRPTGSRPPPNASPTRHSLSKDDTYRPRNSMSSARSSHELNQSRSSSVLSYYQGAGSISSGRSSPEKMFYAAAYRDMEQRQSEKEEAYNMRMALENTVKGNRGSQVFSAAQEEAAELVWKHQNPNTPYRAQPTRQKVLHEQHAADEDPYDYPIDPADYDDVSARFSQENATPVPRSHAQQSPERSPSKRLANRFSMSRMSAKRRSITSLRNVSGTIRKAVFPNSKEQIWEDKESPVKASPTKVSPTKPAPQEPSKDAEVPVHVRRNPFARAQAAKQDQQPGFDRSDVFKSMKRINTDRAKQNWNPDYMSSDSPRLPSAEQTPTGSGYSDPDQDVRYKDGIEVRSDDIRAATSMRLKDRSPRLPSPTVVSDNPSRPIVSFNHDWQPQEVEKDPAATPRVTSPESSMHATSWDRSQSPESLPKPAQPHSSCRSDDSSRASRVRSFADRANTHTETSGRSRGVPYSMNGDRSDLQTRQPSRSPARSSTLPSTQASRRTLPQVPSVNADGDRRDTQRGHSKPPSLSRAQTKESGRSQPDLGSQRRHVEPQQESKANAVPSVNVSGPQGPEDVDRRQQPRQRQSPPSMQVSAPNTGRQTPSDRHSQDHGMPTISVAGPEDTIESTSAPSRRQRGSRYNPMDPPQAEPRPGIRHAETAPTAAPRGHWTPMARSNGALCAQCALPISGRIVTAAGTRFHPECFICYHCSEALECVAFYPEPDLKRDERLERIDRRMAGGQVEPPQGSSHEEDNDDSLRFYCHLDFHEFFSPRCKHCKTPIEGEVIVACGSEWHVGHFFCAECGDPFNPQIPFVEKEGYAWCVNCHTNRASARCKKCKKPVTDMVLKALGGDWHDECFRCFECDSTFADGKFFLRGDKQDPVCSTCEARRLKAGKR